MQQHIVKASVSCLKSQPPATAGAVSGHFELSCNVVVHKTEPACRLCGATLSMPANCAELPGQPWCPSLTACCAHARCRMLTMHNSSAEAYCSLLLCQVELKGSLVSLCADIWHMTSSKLPASFASS